MTRFDEMWNERIQEELDAKEEEVKNTRLCQRTAEILRLVFAGIAVLTMSAVDSREWILVILILFMSISLAVVSHLLALGFREAADELEGLREWPWEEMTCRDCLHNWRMCTERDRLYPCRDFEPVERKKKHGRRQEGHHRGFAAGAADDEAAE